MREARGCGSATKVDDGKIEKLKLEIGGKESKERQVKDDEKTKLYPIVRMA